MGLNIPLFFLMVSFALKKKGDEQLLMSAHPILAVLSFATAGAAGTTSPLRGCGEGKGRGEEGGRGGH